MKVFLILLAMTRFSSSSIIAVSGSKKNTPYERFVLVCDSKLA